MILNKLPPKLLNKSYPLHVTEPLIEIDPRLTDYVSDAAFSSGDPRLEQGPYLFADGLLKRSECRNSSSVDYSLYGVQGPVEKHKDQAGHTYGLVILAQGEQYLCAGNMEKRLLPGCVYHINSDKYHWVSGAKPNQSLLFVTHDFGWTKYNPELPKLEYDAFANDAYQSFMRLMEKENNCVC